MYIVKEKLKVWLIVFLIIFLILCVSEVVSGIQITKDDRWFNLASAAVGIGAFILFWYISSCFKKLKDINRRREKNYVFEFSKEPHSYLSFHDSVLADLAHDYGLSDSELDRLVNNGIHDAVHEYRKSHPLQYTPSHDLDTVSYW